MYQSESLNVRNTDKVNAFTPIVSSAYRILADNTYMHICSDEEKAVRLSETVAFIRCTHGQGKIITKSKAFILNKNEYIFVKFYDIIKYFSISYIWEYNWVNFTAENCSEFELNKIYSSTAGENEKTAFERFISISNHTENTNYINSLFLAYFYIVTEENGLMEAEFLSKQKNRLIDEMCSYIQQRLFDRLTVSDVASFFKITERRLHQIFVSELNISPKQYIIKKKMEEGYKLLVQTSAPVNRIAEMLSFSSSYHFSNEFKKTFNLTPTEVRNMENK